MTSQATPHVVIRLVPESPVDGWTFSTYLDGLALQIIDPNTSDPLSDLVYSSPLILAQLPPGSGFYYYSVSLPTAAPTGYVSKNDYGDTLAFDDTRGIPVGATFFGTIPSIDGDSGLTVTEVTGDISGGSNKPNTIQLNNELQKYIPAGTVAMFYANSNTGTPNNPQTTFSFDLETSSPATTINGELFVLHFADTSGVTIGMTVSDSSSIARGTTVAEVTDTTVVVSQHLLNSPSSVTFTLEPPYIWVQRTPASGSPAAHPRTLEFTPDDVDGLAIGMALQPSQGPGGLVAPGTSVLQVIKGTDKASTTVTLSKDLLRPLAHGDSVTFTFPLSSGIAQHSLDVFGGIGSPFPAAVATAVIPLNSAPPDYLDISIKATRGQEVISIGKTFYNVRWSSDTLPDTPDQYQAIPTSDTSFYLALPPPPALTPISLTIPSDGSAPQFDELKNAILATLANEKKTAEAADPVRDATLASLITSPTLCARVSYDIVWSDQNTLPVPPDPLESLYTNPPNPGGGGGNSGSDANKYNNLEQDRQKFEGALSSFYSTRDATAERLTKFVAAASAAVACEQMSLNSAAALLEFPVDPLSAFASAVESELLLQGLGVSGPSGQVFGVPAAFFYALGVHLDKTTTATQRFKMATGEAIDRLLQQFATAENLQVINDQEFFTDPSLTQSSITAFQAARRLVALGVSAASNSPSVTVFAGSPLASLVSTWLSATDPPAQNPPLTYQNNDFNIWTQQIAAANPQGYLDLDLDAVTQGCVIPPFAASPSTDVDSGSTLTFALGSGIGVGMPVYGSHIANGTTVQSIAASVTLSTDVSGDVPAGSVIMFAPVTATTTADCPAGAASLTFGGTSGISTGMSVFGTNIAAGTTVLGVTATTVTISRGVPGDVPAGSSITFAPVTATTTADCPAGAVSLTFAGPGAVGGITAGMPVSGPPAIAAGATVRGAPAIVVTLSAATTGRVSATSLLVFNFGITPVTKTSTADCPPGTTLLTFGATDGISSGMMVFGASIAAGTTVHDTSATTVTLSTAVAGDVPSGSDTTFVVPPATPLYPLTAATVVDCQPGITLTFAGTDGIGTGMPVSGTGIAAGTTVHGTTGTTVTLDTGVAADVPSGSVIAFGAVTATTTAASPVHSTSLTLDATDGISVGMFVSGPDFAAGTTVHDVTGTTVTLSAAVSAEVPSGSVITFALVFATTTADCPPAITLTFGPGRTDGITAGMPVSGTGIAAGTTVQGVTGTTVTLDTGAAADVPSGSVIAFGPVAAATTAQCPVGSKSLSFTATDGIGTGMSVFGTNIAPGTTVDGVTATAVTLSIAVPADVPGGSMISFAVVPSTLADQIAAWLPATTSPPTPHPVVATLKQVTATQWTTFFTVVGSPQWLPPFTEPAAPAASSGQAAQKAGYVAGRIRAFVRAVQQFFSVSTAATAAQLPPADAAATFDLPVYDPIARAIAGLGGFQFGDTLSAAALAAAAQGVFPADPAAQAWLCQAMTSINALWTIAGAASTPAPDSGKLPYPVSYRFSVMEALYARGFLSAADITALPEADFQQALTGTVAYDCYDALWQKAQQLAPNSPAAGQPGGSFQPINPDGSLVNCVPPPCMSPTGPIAYLQEMLTLSELSTCDTPVAAPVTLVTTADAGTETSVLAFASAAGVLAGMSAAAADQIPAGTTVTDVTDVTVTLSQPLTADAPTGTSITFTMPTLGTVLGQRRGPVGELTASRANLETPLPLIDLVNECLEHLGAAATPAGGAVYDTTAEGPEGDHDPALLLAARPEHSTPATPDAANAAVQPAVFDNLKKDFSSCLLPYSQALDVSRTYLGQLGSSRFEEMRTFRRCITEFVLDPMREPSGFESWLWRYPVRVDTAIEYLGITPEEYTTLFTPHAPSVPASPEAARAPRSAIGLPAFLAETCLSYCEFYELQESGFVTFRCGSAGKGDGRFPECEPCCPEDLWLQFPEGQQDQDMGELAVFVRLWRKLREHCHGGYSFAQVRDICDVLRLRAGDAVNPDFIRQLAAFQMLRDEFRMDLTDPSAPVAPGAVDADRTHLLALWARPKAARWQWAVRQLITRVEEHAQRRHGCDRRPDEFVTMLTANLGQLSRLAGFDPDSATDSWHALPTHTLRFAEVLAKVYASSFSVGELIFLFTADPGIDGEDPFPLQGHNEALDDPLELPDDEPEHGLWRLRRELLKAGGAMPADGEADDERDETDARNEAGEAEEAEEAEEVEEASIAEEFDEAEEAEEAEDWPWRRIERVLQAEFGFAAADIAALGQHFFPGLHARSAGHQGAPSPRYFVTSLTAASTSPDMWNDPLRYDTTAQQLSACIPLTDRAVIVELTRVRELNAAERQAVQDLFFQPRALLARFALLFADFAVAQQVLIEEADEACRFAYFRRQFLLCRRRSQLIARHLERHVTAVTGLRAPDEDEAAALILRTLAADENEGSTSWESDSGAPPQLTWPLPGGGALAALLGLAGTGLLTEYRLADDSVAWRDESGGLGSFGHERDRENCPVPTVLPGLNATPTPEQLRFARVHNGFLIKDTTGARLGGAQGFTATWSGALLIEQDGRYEFWAGVPVPGEDSQGAATAGCGRWRVVIRRGQRIRATLSHHWPETEEQPTASLSLKRGAYELRAELVQPVPESGDDEARARHTGFSMEYRGPDSGGHRTVIPHRALFTLDKDQELGAGIEGLSSAAAAYLSGLYVSSLRDIRRTYQRAFKALLFCRRLGLSARRQPHGTSELGYLLGHPALFAGAGYYRAEDGFTQHLADLDFDFLPLRDDYRPPASGQDARTAPSLQRVQAMFDWWERLFDYGVACADVHRRDGGTLWHLFEQAQEKQPAHPDYLLRYLAADSRHWHLDLRYFQGQDAPVYEVSGSDLSDERWTLRAWRADRWLRAARDRFAAPGIETARPDLWASDDPSAELPGETQTGNANLVAFVTDGWLADGASPHYDDLRHLNDGLRERGRCALIAYLCRMDRVPVPWLPGQFATTSSDLSDLLLLNVEAGPREKASRVEEAITAAQSFVRRSRLGLEPGWTVTREFARLWDSRFETYRTWERARRRELYREDWIEWDELDRARGVEAFRFLESQLRASTLTLAAPGGLDWWRDDDRALERGPELLERRVPSEVSALPPAPAWTSTTGTSITPATREGFTTLGRPESAAQPTWLAAMPQATDSSGTDGTSGAGPEVAARPAEAGTARSLAAAAAAGATAPESLPLWMESAVKLGTRFVRVAAAGPPEAALRFVPHSGEPDGTCCRECGRDHPAGVDEYYFWLTDTQVYTYSADTDASDSGDASFSGTYQFGFQDSYYDQFQQQSAEWDDENQVPPLLAKWRPSPAVRLAWCRVHNGEFGQPRRSEGYVMVDAPPDLLVLGRAEDSLYFEVTGSAALPPGYGSGGDGSGNGDPSPPGFRYDLPSDEATALPEVLEPPAPTATYPGGLLSYPFFAYEQPGARLFPASWFSASLAVAGALRTRCGYELALRWYRRAFDPLQQDCAWTHCPGRADTTAADQPGTDQIAAQAYRIWQQHGRPDGEAEQDWQQAKADLLRATAAEAVPSGRESASPGACCDATHVTEQGARDRAVTLQYCRTLIDWADALMRRDRSPEAFQQARVLYETAARITGPRPRTVLLPEPATASSVTAFVPAYAPLNPRLIELYDLVADRLELIRRSLDVQRLRNGWPGQDMPYFGNGSAARLREGEPSWAAAECAAEDWCGRPSPYRFMTQIQKAIELAGRVRELGGALLSAYEKGDAEYLAAIHAEQEREMHALTIAIRQDQWRDADWQVQALQQTKDVNQANLLYYAGLYQVGLINNEIQNQDLTTIALATRTGANIVEAAGEIMNIIPDPFVGAMSSGASVPAGTKLAHLFEAIGKIMQTVADILSTTASMDLTQAGWERRAVEWLHQMQTLPIEIHQIELQILGAHRRRDQAMRELNNQQRQLEHATEVLDFLRDKFTATDLYLYLQTETAALYRQMYELAIAAAREAERSFHFELRRGHQRFAPEETWDSLHAGLLAGERLDLALRRMEKAYLNENRRELELTKHISLRLDFPAAYLRLRTTGYCEISIPEWMYDVDYPGHYLRRLKALQALAPAVTGPLTGVHCRLTLLSSTTRVSPEVRPPAGHCCHDGRHHSEYAPCADDPRVVREYAARDSIATSSGQNDSGLFELNFRDERYLPFEYLGAVSRWRIELPPENNYFDLDTLTDLVLHISYTAREGGAALREAAARVARGRLPGDGLRLFDVRHDFPDAWPGLRELSRGDDSSGDGVRPRQLRLGFTRAMFPFVPGRPVRTIDRLMLVFAAPGAVPGRHHKVRFWRDEADRERATEVECVADEALPGFFCGTVDLREHPLGPLRDGRPENCMFEFPARTGKIPEVFVVASYDAAPGSEEG